MGPYEVTTGPLALVFDCDESPRTLPIHDVDPCMARRRGGDGADPGRARGRLLGVGCGERTPSPPRRQATPGGCASCPPPHQCLHMAAGSGIQLIMLTHGLIL